MRISYLKGKNCKVFASHWFGLILKHVYVVFCVTHLWLFLDLKHFTFSRNAKYTIKEILFLLRLLAVIVQLY